MSARNLAVKMDCEPPDLGAPELRTRILAQAPCAPVLPSRGAVGEDERVDKGFEDALAEARREAWDAGGARRERDRRRARAALTLGERLDLAVAALKTTSTVAAGPVARSAKSAVDERDPGPPKAQTAAIDANLKVITHHVAQIERVLDGERGLLKGAGTGKLTTEEKDKIISDDFEGVRAEDVAAAAPYLGTSGRTIMRAREREAERRKLKIRLVDGVVLGPRIEGA